MSDKLEIILKKNQPEHKPVVYRTKFQVDEDGKIVRDPVGSKVKDKHKMNRDMRINHEKES